MGIAHKFPGLPEYPCTRPSWIPSAFAHSASAPRHWAGALPKASSNNCLGPPGLLGHRTGQWEPTDIGRPSPSHLVSPLSPLQGSLTLPEGLTRQRWRDRDFCPPGQLASSSHVLNLQSPGHTQKGEAGRLESPGVCCHRSPGQGLTSPLWMGTISPSIEGCCRIPGDKVCKAFSTHHTQWAHRKGHMECCWAAEGKELRGGGCLLAPLSPSLPFLSHHSDFHRMEADSPTSFWKRLNHSAHSTPLATVTVQRWTGDLRQTK